MQNVWTKTKQNNYLGVKHDLFCDIHLEDFFLLGYTNEQKLFSFPHPPRLFSMRHLFVHSSPPPPPPLLF